MHRHNKKYNFNNEKKTLKEIFEYLSLDESDAVIGNDFVLYYRRMTNFGANDHFKTDISKPDAKIIFRAMNDEISFRGERKTHEIILAILEKSNLEEFIRTRKEVLSIYDDCEDMNFFSQHGYYAKSVIFQYLRSAENEKKKIAEKEKESINAALINNENEFNIIKRRL